MVSIHSVRSSPSLLGVVSRTEALAGFLDLVFYLYTARCQHSSTGDAPKDEDVGPMGPTRNHG